MKPGCGFFLIVFLLLMKVSFGQKENNTALDTKISIEARNQSITSVLDKISLQTHVYFSYNTALIDTTKRIEASLNNKTIREILDVLFEAKLVYQALDDQIIITHPLAEAEKKRSPTRLLPPPQSSGFQEKLSIVKKKSRFPMPVFLS